MSKPSNDKLAQQESLLTKRALQLSLSPPRCPPPGTAHHAVLLGKQPMDAPFAQHHSDEQAHSEYNHHTGARERIQHLLYNAHLPSSHPSHPHLAPGPQGADALTRFIGGALPLAWQNHIRDSGSFRSICDRLVTASFVPGAMVNPSAALRFLRLTQSCRFASYGEHPSQVVDMFEPKGKDPSEWTGMLYFVHGGAWGSGKPWFYRLLAQPFLELNMVVAIVGYRVYPDADVPQQVEDLEAAYQFLSQEYPTLCGPNRSSTLPIGFCVSGHSSGAHIALYMVVEQIKRMVAQAAQPNNGAPPLPRPPADSYVGISGPYDISHHFDYEAARGVEEISPLKPANGHTRQTFHVNTPAQRLKDFLSQTPSDRNYATELAIQSLFPRTLLIHGIEDDTVPFTSTCEAAMILRQCGVLQLQEHFAPLTGHQDAVIHLMLGGRVQTAMVDWLKNLSSMDLATAIRSRL
eukprot:Nitzschia sp. Nitz4//scaffold134_size62860//51430//52924//NITZ4_006336-RA/size62860-snap-gene-0.7-mRNA-1//-1//CDS//3329535520//2075//frame0